MNVSTLTLCRHGKRHLMSGRPDDGPLKLENVGEIVANAQRLASEFNKWGITHIDRMASPTFMRNMETGAYVWRELKAAGIEIMHRDTDPAYSMTAEEDAEYRRLYDRSQPYFEQFSALKKSEGELAAYTKMAPGVVEGWVERTVVTLRHAFARGDRHIILITNAPNDILIEEAVTGNRREKSLEQGDYRVCPVLSAF